MNNICEELDYILKLNGYIFISISKTNRVTYRDTDGFIFESPRHSLLKGSFSGLAGKNNPNSLNNISKYIRMKRLSYKLSSDNIYINAKKKLELICSKCSISFLSTWDNIKSKKVECPNCRLIKSSLKTLYPLLAKEWDNNKNNISIDTVMYGSGKKAWWICSTCSSSFYSEIRSRATNDTGCPRCSTSKGEKKVSAWLNSNGIEYEVQKRFDGCKNKIKLPFDFYLTHYGILIEYDGILHYEDKFNSPISFHNTIKNDKIKTLFCRKNKIPLIRIPYWQYDSIDKLLSNIIYEGGIISR